jgi:signal transduction histidine kinase
LPSPTVDNFSSADSFEAERLGLARRLHETLAQDLAAIGYRLDAVIAEPINIELRAEIREIRMEVMRVAQGFRDEIYQTRLHTRNDVAAFIAQNLHELRFTGDFNYPVLHKNVEAKLNEVLIEIARNTLKHSRATRFYLRHEITDRFLILEVGDDGIGMVKLQSNGFGLIGIDELLKQFTAEYLCTANETGTHFRIIIDRKHLE